MPSLTDPDGDGGMFDFSGGNSYKNQGGSAKGGFGSHQEIDEDGSAISNRGGSLNTEDTVGGGGRHTSCDESDNCRTVGGSGLHDR